MMRKIQSILLLILLCGGISIYGRLPLPQNKDRSETVLWKEIIELQEAAKRETNIGRRAALYNDAVDKLGVYIRQFVPDKRSVTYLKCLCRLGAYEENAGNLGHAKIDYQECRKHPMISSTDAIFNSILIKDFVETRLNEIAAAMPGLITSRDASSIKP